MVDIINDPKPLTRTDLSKFLGNDQRAIRTFEELFRLIPSELNTIFEAINDGQINEAIIFAKLSRIIATIGAPKVDYVDFERNPPHSGGVGSKRRISWHVEHDTLDIHQEDTTIQHIGEDVYIRAVNNTGSTVLRGSVVGFDGASGDLVELKKYDATGNDPSFYILGIVANDIEDGQNGRMVVLGNVERMDTTGTPYGEVWLVGDILYASPTVIGGLTKVKPTAPNTVAPLAIVLTVNATTGVLYIKQVLEQKLGYGRFTKTTDQTPAVINTAYAITFDNNEESSFVSIGTPTSRIVVAQAGLYSIGIDMEISSSNAAVKNVWTWFRVNGVDVVRSAKKVSLESASALTTPSKNMILSLSANDYIEVMFAADNINVAIDNIPATGFAPDAPACTIVIEQIQQ
jgi:hypothetical protein